MGKITPEELHVQAKRMASSSAGPDGITGEEVAHLPLRFWGLLADRLEVWSAAGLYPEAWRHCRTVFIPKDTAARKGGEAEVSRMRPISVFSSIYRVVVSTWTSSQATRRWLDSVSPDFFHGGLQGRTAQQALRRLDVAWGDDRILASLDFMLCFDYVDPFLALRNMQLYGAPAGLLGILKWTWCHQRRWLQLGEEVLPEPEAVDSSLPQGCPASPLALLLLLRLPALTVSQLLGPAVVQSVFVDDRNLVVNTPEQAKLAVECWDREATELGLNEHRAKRRFVTRSAVQREALRRSNIEPSSEAEVLGTVFGVEEVSVEDSARMQTFKQALQRLCVLPVSQQRRQQMYRSILIPQLVWGLWWARSTVKEQSKVTTLVRRAVGGVASGARSLWKLLAGHFTDVEFILRMHHVSSFFSAEQHWRGRGLRCVHGQWGKAVCMFLESKGYSAEDLVSWVHPSEPRLDLGTKEGLQRGLRTLREQWRRQQYDDFIAYPRDEAVEIAQAMHEGYNAARVKKAMRLYRTATACGKRSGSALAL